MAIYAVLGCILFADRDLLNFGSFSRAYFTMFQVCYYSKGSLTLCQDDCSLSDDEILYRYAQGTPGLRVLQGTTRFIGIFWGVNLPNTLNSDIIILGWIDGIALQATLY